MAQIAGEGVLFFPMKLEKKEKAPKIQGKWIFISELAFVENSIEVILAIMYKKTCYMFSFKILLSTRDLGDMRKAEIAHVQF